MNHATAQRIVLARRPVGKPSDADFRLEQVAVPVPGPGQLLLGALYLSLDPYMRGRMDDVKSYAAPTPIDGVMEGESLTRVLVSDRPGYKAGDLVLARTGWQTHF